MSLDGTVRNGVVVLDDPRELREGTRVKVVVVDGAPRDSTLAGLLKYAGVASDLPADMAAQHDHYLHGTPKR
jgi:hypothetical protein